MEDVGCGDLSLHFHGLYFKLCTGLHISTPSDIYIGHQRKVQNKMDHQRYTLICVQSTENRLPVKEILSPGYNTITT